MDKIICLGKNYLEHAKELGDAVPEKPVLFLKPPSILVSVNGGEERQVKLVQGRGEVHHECEIVLRIHGGEVEAVSLGLDMTLRDEQAKLKKAGHPWTVSKVFASSAIVGPWVSIKKFPDFLNTAFTFHLDNELRQTGKGNEMGMKPAEAVKYAAAHFPLCDGDLIFTGTPKGVGPVKAGQKGSLRWGEVSYSINWV